MNMLGHVCVSKFLKEIEITLTVIFCVGTSQPEKFHNLLSFFTKCSLFVLANVVLKKCIKARRGAKD